MVEMEVQVEVLDTEIVIPMEKTPQHVLPLNQLDHMTVRAYMPLLCYYRHNGDPSFFSAEALKASLSKVLVPFYPLAGQLVVSYDGRLELKCTGEGALFVVARSGSTLDELGEVVPSKAMTQKLLPSSASGDPPCTAMMLQVTFFRCGGVCLGSLIHHSIVDGVGAGYFMSSWSKVARGGEVTVPPFLDRTILHARSPPLVRFDHIEHTDQVHGDPTTRGKPFETAVLKLSRNQVSMLKSFIRSTTNVSTFTVVATHLWRCACRARRLADHQETRLYTTINFHKRLVPPLPPGYLGVATSRVSTVSTVAKLLSSSFELGAARIRNAVARADDEYLRSLIDFVCQLEKVERLMIGSWALRPTDFWITSWLGLPLRELDFGWGTPSFVVRGFLHMAGLMYILPSLNDDGGVTLLAGFETETMQCFKKMLYEDLTADCMLLQCKV